MLFWVIIFCCAKPHEGTRAVAVSLIQFKCFHYFYINIYCMNYLKKNYPLLLFFIVITIVYSLLILTANYKHFPANGITEWLQIVAHWILSAFGMFCLILVMGANRYLFIVLLPLFTFMASVAAHFTWQFDVSINSALIESMLHTNTGEVMSYVSTPLVLFVLISLGISALTVFLRFRFKWSKREVILAPILFVLCLFIFRVTNRIRYNTMMDRAPYSIYLATKHYLSERKEIKKDRVMLGKDANTNNDSLITVFIIGEALRADHIQVNGYHRVTMPYMERRGVVFLPNIFSPYTHTAQSLPYILTRATEDSLHSINNESSFINAFNTSSFYTVWLGNQNPIRNFRFFVNECDTVLINKPQISDRSNVKKVDSDLIEPFQSIIKKGKPKNLVNLHFIGNHWWYNSNYPDSFAVFTPILENKIVSSANLDRMINSYDNATLFSDFVLDQLISYIEDKKAILIFLADHGQSFGEDGKWLHANNVPAEQNPAGFIWMSDKYKADHPEKVKALLNNRNNMINTSFLFHTIIDGSLIETDVIDFSQSLFSKDFQPETENVD